MLDRAAFSVPSACACHFLNASSDFRLGDNQLRFAFGFKHIAKGRLCNIESAKIVTQKQTQPLKVENGTRFTVPTDKVLKMAKAIVEIDLNDRANQCDMSVQLETLPEYLKTSYSHKELQTLLTQYQAFFFSKSMEW